VAPEVIERVAPAAAHAQHEVAADDRQALEKLALLHLARGALELPEAVGDQRGEIVNSIRSTAARRVWNPITAAMPPRNSTPAPIGASTSA
jgi:hypothetical protein